MSTGALVIWSIISTILLVAVLAIYVYTLKNKEPMNFWSGQSFSPREITDVKAYNRSLSRIFLGWVLFAVLFALSPFIGGYAPIVISIAGIIILPTASIIAYKYIYKKYSNPCFVKATSDEDRKSQRNMLIAVLITILVIFAITLPALFLIGGVSAYVEDDELKVRSTVLNVTIPLDDISSVELRDDFDTGSRHGGMENIKMNMGQYENEEFGRYKLASYNDVNKYIVVHYGPSDVLVFNLESSEETVSFYNELLDALNCSELRVSYCAQNSQYLTYSFQSWGMLFRD